MDRVFSIFFFTIYFAFQIFWVFVWNSSNRSSFFSICVDREISVSFLLLPLSFNKTRMNQEWEVRLEIYIEFTTHFRMQNKIFCLSIAYDAIFGVFYDIAFYDCARCVFVMHRAEEKGEEKKIRNKNRTNKTDVCIGRANYSCFVVS